jgi:hypothetical protein
VELLISFAGIRSEVSGKCSVHWKTTGIMGKRMKILLY